MYLDLLFFSGGVGTPDTYGSSQAGGPIGGSAAGTATAMPDLSRVGNLHHSPVSEAKHRTHILMDTGWVCFR